MDTTAIEKIRARFEADILAVKGVVSVAVGLSANGEACLQIGTQHAPDLVSPHLPEGIFQVPVELIHIGKVEAQ